MYEVNAVVTTFILIILYLRNYVDESRLIHIIKANAIALTHERYGGFQRETSTGNGIKYMMTTMMMMMLMMILM